MGYVCNASLVASRHCIKYCVGALNRDLDVAEHCRAVTSRRREQSMRWIVALSGAVHIPLY